MVLLYLLIVLSLVPLGVFSAEGSFTPHTALQPPGLDNFWSQEGWPPPGCTLVVLVAQEELNFWQPQHDNTHSSQSCEQKMKDLEKRSQNPVPNSLSQIESTPRQPRSLYKPRSNTSPPVGIQALLSRSRSALNYTRPLSSPVLRKPHRPISQGEMNSALGRWIGLQKQRCVSGYDVPQAQPTTAGSVWWLETGGCACSAQTRFSFCFILSLCFVGQDALSTFLRRWRMDIY